MTRELVISVGPGECLGVLFEDGEPVELAVERDDRPSQVGAVYLGRVQRIAPALGGAFVDIGTDRPAFLPKAKGLTDGARIVVQVVKDAFDDKGPEVRAAIELHGQHAAHAEGRPRRLDRIRGPLESLLTAYGAGAERVLIDDRATVAQARQIAEGRLAEYAAPDGEPVMRLEEAFSAALANIVALPGGGRLQIEPGTAFTSVDVDLGGLAAGRRPAADSIRQVNLAAAETLAKELRRRGIGGAVVVDFVSMTRRGDRRDVEAALAAGVAGDPAGVQLHGWTRLGHFELTRRRIRPSLADVMIEPAGDRLAKSALTIGLEVLRAFARHAFAPAGLAVSLNQLVSTALAGLLSRHVQAAEAQTSQRLMLLPDPARPLESFEIRAGSR